MERMWLLFFFQAEDGIRDGTVTGVQTCALPILWKFVNGVRSQVKRGTKAVPLELGTWNEIKVVTNGVNVKGYLNGDLIIDQDWTSRKIGRASCRERV